MGSITTTVARVAACCAAAAFTAGCNSQLDEHGPTGTKDFGAVHTLATDATRRLVTGTPVTVENDVGHFKPTQITCAEPSPDVANALSTAFNAGITVNFQGQVPNMPADLQAKLAASIARSRAEAIAQLTERLPTIQLLRDGLYRACEAYANGALTPISYALLLSRYGDTMVTMLGSELIAGDFGRPLVELGGTAGGNSAASQTDTANTQNTLNTSSSGGPAGGGGGGAGGAGGAGAGATAQQQTISDQASAIRNLSTQLTTSAQSNAGATFGATAALTAQTIGADRAQVIARMQRDYMGTPSPGAVIVACVTAMDRQKQGGSPQGDSEFLQACKGQGTTPGILAAAMGMMKDRMAALQYIEADSHAVDKIKGDITRVSDTQAALKALQAAAAPAPKTPAPGSPPAAPACAAKATPDSAKRTASQIKAAQTALQSKGLYKDGIDGNPGPQTRTAVAAYQKVLGLPVTCDLDDATFKDLTAAKDDKGG
jgi:hypothetical protein